MNKEKQIIFGRGSSRSFTLYVSNLIKENKRLKDRINKAVEYINEQECFMFGILENDEFVWKDTETKKDLFKILKGDSNDNEQ